jgi:hypothetical protein
MKKTETAPTSHTITLHTRTAQRLFIGDWRKRYIGVVQFAQLTKGLYMALNDDNPQAALVLEATHHVLQQSRHVLRALERYCGTLRSTCRGITFNTLSTSQHTRQLPVAFATPDAYQAAYMVADFDCTLHALIQCDRFGLAPSPTFIQEARQATRQIVSQSLRLPILWQAAESVETITERLDTAKAAHAALCEPWLELCQ